MKDYPLVSTTALVLGWRHVTARKTTPRSRQQNGSSSLQRK
jgi:hypothetical protein